MDCDAVNLNDGARPSQGTPAGYMPAFWIKSTLDLSVQKAHKHTPVCYERSAKNNSWEKLERFCNGNIIEMTIAGYKLFSMSERRKYGYKSK